MNNNNANLTDKLIWIKDQSDCQQILIRNGLTGMAARIAELPGDSGMGIAPFKTEHNFALAFAFRVPDGSILHCILGMPVETGKEGKDFMSELMAHFMKAPDVSIESLKEIAHLN